MNRINELVRVAKEWQRAIVLKYASSSRHWKTLGGGGRVRGDLCNRRGGVQSGSTSLAGWSDAAWRDQLAEGRRRLGYVIGVTSSTLSGPCHISQWTTTFTRKLVRGSLGGGVYALSERMDHVLFLLDFLKRMCCFFWPESRYGGVGGTLRLDYPLGDKENDRRDFLSAEQALGEGE